MNGNITSMYRKGATVIDAAGQATAFGVIDNMTYTYANHSNLLTEIDENLSNQTIGQTLDPNILKTKGFKDNTLTNQEYTYDANGNTVTDANKQVNIEYNHLNLPTKFIWYAIDGFPSIEITYDAAGVKLTKTKTEADGTVTIKHYIGGIEYNGNDLEAVAHAEGRATYEANSTTSTQGAINGFRYEYSIKDHLGNARVMFSDMNGNGQVTETEIIQVEHYYPFGMSQEGHGHAIISETNYTYNGKELNDDFDLGLHDYGARWYDAAVGRWQAIDPLAEAFIVHSPYNYGVNNPIMMVDPDGRASQCAMCGGKPDWAYTSDKMQNNMNKVQTEGARGRQGIANKKKIKSMIGIAERNAKNGQSSTKFDNGEEQVETRIPANPNTNKNYEMVYQGLINPTGSSGRDEYLNTINGTLDILQEASLNEYSFKLVFEIPIVMSIGKIQDKRDIDYLINFNEDLIERYKKFEFSKIDGKNEKILSHIIPKIEAEIKRLESASIGSEFTNFYSPISVKDSRDRALKAFTAVRANNKDIRFKIEYKPYANLLIGLHVGP